MAKLIKPIQKPPPPGKPGGLGEKIEATIERVVAGIFNAIKDLLVDIIGGGIELIMEVFEQGLAKVAGPLIDKVLDKPGLPPEIRAQLEEARNPPDLAFIPVLLGLLLMVGTSAVMSVVAPELKLGEYASDKAVRSARVDPTIAFPLSWRDPSVASLTLDGMQDLGYHDALIDAFEELARPRVSEIDIFRANLRGFITKSTLNQEMDRRGWAAADRNIIEELMQQIPGPQDLVTMAVREAFSPEAIRELGLGAEFPGVFGEWMEKQGFDQEWALRYWYAHWNLPSLSAGYEMLHRDVINTPQLESLLKAQDVSPVWRDRLIEISYSPLTRVDVRRMYGQGVLDRDGVKKAYRELGYDDTNAERLAEFTVRFETDDAREATKSDILSGFREGMLSREEAIDWLQQINYSSEYAGYFVDKESAALARKRQNSQTASVKTVYINHDITEGEARIKLSTLGLASGEIDSKISEWNIAREAKTKRPSKGTLDTLLKGDVITEEEYRKQVAFLGYQDQYLDWYLAMVLDDKAESARKMEDSARTEQEAIRTRKVKSTYQVNKADLDVSLAELATAVAEMQLAIRARQTRYGKELVVVQKALTAVELQQEAAADIEASQADIDDSRDAVLFLKEQIDHLQTAVAANRLEEAEYVTQFKIRMAAAATEEEQMVLADEAADKKLEFETQRRELALTIEQAQDDIARLNISVADTQHGMSARRVQLREELDIVATLMTEMELVAEYDADLAGMREQLDSLRINVTELKEEKARLTVGYRTGLVA